MNHLFVNDISGWDSWGNVFQSISAFESLIKYIFEKENLPYSKVENCTPGTNAVYKVGNYIIKIFAPEESGIDSTTDFETEAFAMNRATMLGVNVPKLITKGYVKDKYNFSYMIMDYIDGTEINKLSQQFTFEEKLKIGKRLRSLTDAINKPCIAFNNIDVVHDSNRQVRWRKYPERFKVERLDYIQSYDYGEKVFVHGDLNGDNILINQEKELYIIDFADAVLAPIIYEHALIVTELFRFDKAYIEGYFGEYDVEQLTELCFNGLLIHDFGGDIMEQHISQVSEFESLDILRKKLYQLLK
ncbi:MAG TPA: aminoglycoside phosphotransferase family protein [Bacillaceae bacterium]|nr:aminoglycoside phosphotransferase family protein [Bacillaceae bacterium]